VQKIVRGRSVSLVSRANVLFEEATGAARRKARSSVKDAAPAKKEDRAAGGLNGAEAALTAVEHSKDYRAGTSS
jgi:hypothetical protein